jgi:hypothetical protein
MGGRPTPGLAAVVVSWQVATGASVQDLAEQEVAAAHQGEGGARWLRRPSGTVASVAILCRETVSEAQGASGRLRGRRAQDPTRMYMATGCGTRPAEPLASERPYQRHRTGCSIY